VNDPCGVGHNGIHERLERKPDAAVDPREGPAGEDGEEGGGVAEDGEGKQDDEEENVRGGRGGRHEEGRVVASRGAAAMPRWWRGHACRTFPKGPKMG